MARYIVEITEANGGSGKGWCCALCVVGFILYALASGHGH